MGCLSCLAFSTAEVSGARGWFLGRLGGSGGVVTSVCRGCCLAAGMGVRFDLRCLVAVALSLKTRFEGGEGDLGTLRGVIVERMDK